MINKDKLMNMLGCDDGFLKELFEKFISESSESINRINKALETNDWTTISGAAHKMLSSTRIFEMSGLSALLKEIEINAAIPGNRDKIPGLVNQLNKELQQTFVELKTF